MGLFNIFNRKPKPKIDKRQEEQKLFRWCLSQEKRRTNIPDEEVDKWFEREDDWRHLEDYGICTEDLEDYGESFNPYMILYDEVFGRNFHKDGVEKQEQNRRFLARCREMGIMDIEKQKAYGAKLERVRFKKELKQEFLRVAAVLLIMVLAGCGVADYFKLGRHTLNPHHVFFSAFSLCISEKTATLGIDITSNPDGKEMLYLAFRKSNNIFDTLYVDSARIINGKAAFKQKLKYPVQAFLSTTPEGAVYSQSSTTSVLYLDTDQPIQCKIDLEKPSDAVVKGSGVNDDWQKAASLEEAYFKEINIITRENSDGIFKRILDSLPADSPVNLTYLTALALNSVDNLDYVKQQLSEMSWKAKSSPAGLRLWKIIDKTEHTGRVPDFIPEFKAIDIEGNIIESSSLVGKGKGMVVFYFWVPGGEYTKFGDYQKEDFEQLQAIYNSSPKGSVSIVTICASTNTDKLAEWQKIIPEYEGKEGWTNLRYYADPKTFKIDNVYDKMCLEGKLPVTLLISPWRRELIYLEGRIDRASTKTMKDYANWWYKYLIR